jgi:hypothetical protein
VGEVGMRPHGSALAYSMKQTKVRRSFAFGSNAAHLLRKAVSDS